jgi:hypothetical protein
VVASKPSTRLLFRRRDAALDVAGERVAETTRSGSPGPLTLRQIVSAIQARSSTAPSFYDEKTAAGDNHHSALRKLGNRWLEVLWHCLHKGVCYDEAVPTFPANSAFRANRTWDRPEGRHRCPAVPTTPCPHRPVAIPAAAVYKCDYGRGRGPGGAVAFVAPQ